MIDAPVGRAEDGVQFAGVVQTWRAAEAAMLGVLHQFGAGQHGINHGVDADRGMLFKWGSGTGRFFDVAREQETLSGAESRRAGELHEGFDAFAA